MIKKLFTLLWAGCGQALLLVTGFWFPLQAQPRIGLRLDFNAEQNRYEVLAKPDFSAKNFNWGPSQVSVVFPAELADEPLSVRSTAAGSWADNSRVYAPASAKGADFHGITSPGAKLDLVAGEEFVLFDFSLKPGFLANVRLYNPGVDPGSAQSGMQGGDFRSYMSDERGVDYLRVASQVVSLAVREPSGVNPAVAVVAYPNPSTAGRFRLYLPGFGRDEQVRVRLVDLRGHVLSSFEEDVESLSGRLLDVGSSVDGYVLLSLERATTHQIFSHKLWFR